MRPVFSGSMHVSDLESDVLQDKPHFGYQSFVTETNITASNSDADYDVASLANYLTTERFKPSAIPVHFDIDCGELVDVNYFGIASHSIGTYGCIITMSYSNNGVSFTEITDMLPTDNRTIMVCFNTVTARFFRVRLTGGTGIPTIGVWNVGKLLTMPYGIYGGHTPITLGRKTKAIRNRTEGGQYAGTSIITEGIQNTVAFKNLTAQWYRDNFDPFVVHARDKPFFFTWRNHVYQRECGFCWTPDDIRPTNMGIRDFMSVEFNLEGYSDE